MRIASREVGPGHPIFLQAEVGTTHNGDVKKALALVDAAADAGLDACKFIVTDPEAIGATQAPYTYETAAGPRTAPIGGLLYETLLTPDEWRRVRDHCMRRGIIFYATVDHLKAIALLEALEVPAYKICAWDLAYMPLLRAVARTNKPVLVDVGTATDGEYWAAEDAMWPRLFPLLAPHPHGLRDWNFVRLAEWSSDADTSCFGFSSPTRESWCDFLAMGLGACLLEKRLTLNRSELEGHHHWISLDPAEMRDWVGSVRMAEAVLAEAPWAGTGAAWAERRRWDRDAQGLRHG